MKRIISFLIVLILVSITSCFSVRADNKLQNRNIEIVKADNQSNANSKSIDADNKEANDIINDETNKFYKYITEEKHKYELI